MPTKTIDKSTKTVAISGTAGFKIGHTCPKCGCDDWFKESPTIQKRAATGKVKYKCRVCEATYKAEHYKTNLHVKATYNAGYYKANADARKARVAEYRKENPHVRQAISAGYRAAKLNAMPDWADKEAIKEKYRNCPKGYQVDHEVPLQGKSVSGLHVPANLQHLPASENARKCNRFKID